MNLFKTPWGDGLRTTPFPTNKSFFSGYSLGLGNSKAKHHTVIAHDRRQTHPYELNSALDFSLNSDTVYTCELSK